MVKLKDSPTNLHHSPGSRRNSTLLEAAEDGGDEVQTRPLSSSSPHRRNSVASGLAELSLSKKKTSAKRRLFGARRSITATLPRNPFSSLWNNKIMDPRLNKDSVAAATATSAGSATSPQQSPFARSQSVRNFFNRVVAQIGSNNVENSSSPVIQQHQPNNSQTVNNSSCSNSKSSTLSSSTSNASKKKETSEDKRIREWKKRFQMEGRVPGVIGIRNHGNTCFMNAILQCLSYTDILAEYFVLDAYKSDLRRKQRRIANIASAFAGAIASASANGLNGLNGVGAANNSSSSTKPGQRGEIAEQLATLLKSLWSLQYDPEISIRFKSLIEKNASQYKGGSQHDAQEFLLWLLDQLHEDLNMATKRRFKTSNFLRKNGFGLNNKENGSTGVNNKEESSQPPSVPSDETLAAESLANYMRCNNSFVMEVFQAQFRSSLTCPTCQRQSNTFDPFLCVSLPIPQKEMMPVYPVVLYIDQNPRQVKLGLTMGIHDTIADLRSTLSKDTGIPLSQLLLTEIDHKGFLRTFRDQDSVTVLKPKKSPEDSSSSETSKKDETKTSEKDEKAEKRKSAVYPNEPPQPPQLFCIEVPSMKAASDDDGAFVVLTWINLLKEGPIERRFGSPYTIQVSRETLYTDLQKLLLKEMAPILHDDILISAQKVPLFKIRVADGFSTDSHAYLDPAVDLPMYTDVVEQAVNLCTLEGNNTGPPHVKLILEWDMPAKTQIIADDKDIIEEHSSVKEIEDSPQEASSVSLQECFGLYTTAEKLGQGDAWLCPSCNRKQEVVKRMGLWSVPDVLVVHLKRFRHCANTSNKLTTLVDFPFENFDMSPNVTKSQPPKEEQPHQPPPKVVENGEEPSSIVENGDEISSPTSETNGSTFKMLTALSPWRHPKSRQHQALNGTNGTTTNSTTSKGANDCIYDLYAVCNHHGDDLQGGHYTAYCKNPTDGVWYSFDDVHTKAIDNEKDVITQDAYILFYQRQSLSSNPNSSSSSSSSSSGSSGSGQEHWAFRMPDFTYKTKNGVVKATPTSPTKFNNAKNEQKKAENVGTSKTEESEKVDSKNAEETKKSNFERNSAKYATMPAKRSATTTDAGDFEPDHTSDIEYMNGDDDDEDTVELSSETAKIKPAIKAVAEDIESSSSGEEDDDDISKPLDKNDVD